MGTQKSVLSNVAKQNPSLHLAVRQFYKLHNQTSANLIVKLAREAIKPLNGESKHVLKALRKLFVSKDYLGHMASLYEIEATKHDKVSNNDIAAQLYVRAASETSNLNITVPFYSRAFCCFIYAEKPLDAIKVAKILMAKEITQGMVLLYYTAGKISEAMGQIDDAREFYSFANEGDYQMVLRAQEAAKRLESKSVFYDYDSRFANKDTD